MPQSAEQKVQSQKSGNAYPAGRIYGNGTKPKQPEAQVFQRIQNKKRNRFYLFVIMMRFMEKRIKKTDMSNPMKDIHKKIQGKEKYEYVEKRLNVHRRFYFNDIQFPKMPSCQGDC